MLDHSRDHTSLYYHHPKKFSLLPFGMFLKKGGITNWEMKIEKGAGTPFCTIGKPEISIKNKTNNTNMLDC